MTLTAGQLAAISAPIRHQRFLVQIDINGQTLRLSSGGTVTWDSQTWSKSGVFVSQVKNGKGGMETARIEVPNQNHAYTLLAINNAFAFATIQVWEYYGTGNPASDAPIKKFFGEVADIPTMNRKVIFDCASKGATTKRLPNLTLTPPDVNHMPYGGQRFTVGNEIYTVELN